MNIKIILAYGAYYGVWCAIFYGMLMVTIICSKNYNVNLVCLIISLVFGCIIEPFMSFIKKFIYAIRS